MFYISGLRQWKFAVYLRQVLTWDYDKDHRWTWEFRWKTPNFHVYKILWTLIFFRGTFWESLHTEIKCFWSICWLLFLTCWFWHTSSPQSKLRYLKPNKYFCGPQFCFLRSRTLVETHVDTIVSTSIVLGITGLNVLF